MTSTSPHSDLKALARKDHDAGRIELLNDLKRIPKSEFHNVDPTLLARLTPKQRAELFALTDRKPHSAGKSTKPVKKLKRPYRAHRVWNSLPLPVRSQLSGLLMTTVLSGFAVLSAAHEDKVSALFSNPKTLPISTSTWPRCNRLTPYIDGCIYTATSTLSWHIAADTLDFDTATLMKRNGHLMNRVTLQRGDRLTVWRGQIPLEN